MSYTPTQWQTGDTITAEKLNNMESGIENANELFVINRVTTGGVTTCDKSLDEIRAAIDAGKVCVVHYGNNIYVYLGEYKGTIYFREGTVDSDFFILSFNTSNPAGSLTAKALLPALTNANRGKFLQQSPTSNLWQMTDLSPFIVTCTPTAQDYSGTMDKTVAEINAAYEAGQKLVFRVYMSATEYMDVDCTARYRTSDEYPSFNGYAVITSPVTGIIYAFTGVTSVGTDNTYSTQIYPLTPMS